MNHLNPDKIKIDERSYSDLINFISKLSKNLNYYDDENKIKGTFYDMFSGDESFLISEISDFNISDFFVNRNNLIRTYDTIDNEKEKIKILNSYSKITYNLYLKLNDWFKRAFDKNIELSNTSLQTEIESIVKNQANILLSDFRDILKILNDLKIIDPFQKFSFDEFKSSLWKDFKVRSNNQSEKKFSKTDLDLIFKKIILNSNSIFKTIKTLVNRAESKLKLSLNKNSHNPHIGLLFCFLKLYSYLQEDINMITKSHLDFYYKKILEIKKNSAEPNTTYSVFSLDENLNSVVVNNSEIITAGQYDDGSDVRYTLEDDIVLNNAKISFLMSVFVSKSPIFEYNSRYNLISSVFSKIIASNSSEIQNFNENEEFFNALGIDQDLNNEETSSMNLANIGFAIGSPSFRMGKSQRKIYIDFEFDNKSIKHLSDLIIDISNNTELNDNEVFNKIFLDSFDILFTSPDGWQTVNNFQLIMPDDWSSKTLTMLINIDKSYPSCSNYESNIHGNDFKVHTPIIKFLIKQNSFYNAYAFLNKVKLNKISIKCSVKDLRDFKVFRESQEIPISSEFELFGSTPKINSDFFISCEEVFNKDVDYINIKWNYSNLDEVDYDLKKYYKSYKKNILNNSFKISFSLLSDFNFFEIDFAKNNNEMFKSIDGKIVSERNFKITNILNSKLNPNYNISSGYITDFSNDYETGLIKINLVNPNFGFGFNLYNRLYSDSVSSLGSSSGQNNSDFINEPFVPKINQLSIDYQSQSFFYFDQENRSKNNFEENNSFFQISPLGIKRSFSDEYINNSMFFDLKNEGELIIGFNSKFKIKNLDLFFEIIKNENDNYDFSRKIEWFYSSNDDWKPLSSENILSDGTNNLLNSGVISFVFPDDFTNDNYILKNSEYYLKATSKNRADQLGLIKSIYSNACKVVEVISNNPKNRLEVLKKGSLQGFENSVSGVNSIYQPIDSDKIKLHEDDLEYYKRVSELLKHKNRPITKSDFESFLSNHFSFLSYVKCIDNSDGLLTILCLKKIQPFQNIEEIILSSTEKKMITNFLKKHISPHFDVFIVNPLFEDVWVKCSIQFSKIHIGRGIKKLNNDIFNFICPWRNSSSINQIQQKIKNLDLLNFIKSKDYISHVTGFSVVHFKKDNNNNLSLYDSASDKNIDEYLECGSKRSIIVPRNNHKISIINNKEYVKSSPIKLDDLEIDKSFVIKKSVVDVSKNKLKKNDDEFKNLQFIIN